MGFPLPSLNTQPRPFSFLSSSQRARGRWARKTIHLASGLLLLALWIGGFSLFRLVVWGAFGIAIGVEGLRRTPWGGEMFRRWLGPLLKPHEANGAMTDAFWHLFACALLVSLFPADAALAGFVLLVFADPTAFLVGQKGRLRFPNGKTLEGSLTFLVVAWGLLGMVPSATPFRILITALGGTLTEMWVRRDNLWVPLIGASLWSFVQIFHI